MATAAGAEPAVTVSDALDDHARAVIADLLGVGRGDASLARSGDGDRALPTGSSSEPLTRLSTIRNPTSHVAETVQ